MLLPVVLVKDEYKRYQNRKLTQNVIKTMMTLSEFHCTTWCSMTDGCLAVNVIRNHHVTCELTTGVSSEIEMQINASSRIFVLSKLEMLVTTKDDFHTIELINIWSI